MTEPHGVSSTPHPPHAGSMPPASGSPSPQWAPPAAQPQPAPWSALAIAGFVTAFFIGLIGLVLSILGLREATRTGRRGRGLAIAGIVISALDIVLGVVLGIAVVVGALAWIGGHAAASGGLSQRSADFGSADELPVGGAARGLHQGVVALHWAPEDGSPTASYVTLGTDDPLPAYTDPSGACTAMIDMYTTDLGSGTEFDMSSTLLANWIEGSGSPDKMTGTASFVLAPSFWSDDPGDASAAGHYEVVRSAFADSETGEVGEAWARVFDDGGDRVGIVTAVLCADSASLRRIGVPALEDAVGAAW